MCVYVDPLECVSVHLHVCVCVCVYVHVHKWYVLSLCPSQDKSIFLNGMPSETAPKTCDNAALDEMRRRLTGWFHLLHGKDHQHHHGSGHHHRSHRHMSVKKELRESDAGKRLGCLCGW